jgi:hypothetical protein
MNADRIKLGQWYNKKFVSYTMLSKQIILVKLTDFHYWTKATIMHFKQELLGQFSSTVEQKLYHLE